MPNICSYTGAIQSACSKRRNYSPGIKKYTSSREAVKANEVETLIDTVIRAILMELSSTRAGYPIQCLQLVRIYPYFYGFCAPITDKKIRASVDALCRDDPSEISRDTRTKCLQTRRESLARPSKHTNNNF